MIAQKYIYSIDSSLVICYNRAIRNKKGDFMKEKTKKVSYISVPMKLIRNNTKDNGLNVKAKYLYIILKKLSTNSKVTISYQKLLEELQWTNKKTLKKYLEILKQNNYIDYNFQSIYYYKPLEIKVIQHRPYIMLDRELVNNALYIQIDQDELSPKRKRSNLVYRENGIVYLYFLEANYNAEWGYACPNRKELLNVLTLNNSELTQINEYYHKRLICEFKRGKMITNQEDKTLIMRTRNRYIVNKKDENGNKRYKKHKKDNYFF